ncbi:aminotransferase class-III [Dinoroseobacter shibae DFL 12 = DSM 16493]|jgi:4-aminobutyrate aminotransferase-like enzyme|uniref:Aminotransferase class-III n=1 Tax=Dinoroseobacter shibae (strain DSM 16493 / NCIMB 14021 / DFL 12) TaxID=398580 RepID=A8LNI2_DINSH|nr:aspartate aminotransferase family protein [Dinoroseobacter shibae]ABV95076.1 aminotransferase class-III [Dinoroseobacter shibae DFL 12 = DSM 16493]URF46491.1 aspartate aminotransferase family protein [Dinoroseobacter shibae]URF50797.1 aspartate aminotransferase family protein [Dinoroseobacter shibae]
MSDLLKRRARLMGPNVPTFYDPPLHIVRGEGVWLWDAGGRRYLDCYNNVPHVGHCHPRVVDAIARQARVLNTHTRYLHEGVLDYIERLTGTMDNGLDQALLVCTGSEAVDVALRMARAATGKTGLIATDNTYHGNTTAVAQLSTRRPPIGGYSDHVRLVPAPEPGTDGAAFGAHVARAAAELETAGHGVAALIVCPIFANEGLPCLPRGFLEPAVAALRTRGGLLISDEVQPGFGRLGDVFWGYQALGIAPDVVTLGKSMGNGYPVAGVVARTEIMGAFREAFGYFNTFGGSPVAAAAAMAVLDVLEDEGLVENAKRVGRYTLERLQALRHPAIDGVRGYGLAFALDLVDTDGAPNTALAAAVTEEAKRRSVLINRIGRDMHILKIRPPLPFAPEHGDRLGDVLQAAFDACPR